ncbi:MAG TPA: ABC transporter ATP-binding protein [Sandaracinaceae bacterium LLY-WYZ-13_1]|nr:ABC transporter ATP-binding protein [Sandaracinaceae bacterium LLY-WYZ-13_1]
MIVVDRVSKYYGSTAAVRALDFRIDEGECVGFLGLNGAGKSTTLRLLSCLSMPTSGRITVRGLDAQIEPHAIRRLVGYLPDAPPVYPEMRVEPFLRFAGRLRGLGRAEVARRLPEVVEAAGLEAVVDQPIGTLSHGYRQRVGIAQAIVHRPALLILDEPIQGLDPVQIVEMRERIRALRGAHTILLSSHILSEIARTCDRLLMMHRGRIVAEGTEEELSARLGEPGAGGAMVVELEVRGEAEATRRALAHEDAEAIEVWPGGPGWVRARVRCRGDRREALAAAVVRAGLGLRALRRGSSALEDAFVRLGREADGRPADEEREAEPNDDPEPDERAP